MVSYNRIYNTDDGRETKRQYRSNRSSTLGKARAISKPTRQQRNRIATSKKHHVRSAYNLRSKAQHRERHENSHQTSDPDIDKRRKLYPEECPDLDFHHSFGSFLTHKNPISAHVSPTIARYWEMLGTTPTFLQHHIHDIGDQYRSAFRGFFTADPISLHGHVSDASNVALLTSLISHVVSCAPLPRKISFFSEADKLSPRLAILDGSYGAGYGCLAYDAVLASVRPVANGPRPVIIKVDAAHKIDIQVRTAKKMGCVALIAEIVRSRDGKPISANAWKHLLQACQKHGLILIVDEALTAIRCGAPFAYQLPQYAKYGFPDFVLFGKAVRTNGIAIDWRGVNVRTLGIDGDEDRLFAVLDWQERSTEMAQAADLLMSWGTIALASKEDWPLRARSIGRILRGTIVKEVAPGTRFGGIHSLIYLGVKDNARLASPVMVARAGRHVRWFPVMDNCMLSEQELREKVFGVGSVAYRKELSAYLGSQDVQLGFCSRCGEAVDADVESCEVCVVRVCEECEAGEHKCPMSWS